MSRFLAEGAAHATELPFPSFFFGVIAMSLFLLLGWVTWSYRDVANRRAHKGNNSKANN